VPIRDLKPTSEESRVKLRKAVIQRARAFLDTYQKPVVINPPRVPECSNLLERKTDENR